LEFLEEQKTRIIRLPNIPWILMSLHPRKFEMLFMSTGKL
jgi:hypothetical protein